MERPAAKRVAGIGLVIWTLSQYGAMPAFAAGSAPVTVVNPDTKPVPVRIESGASVGIEPGSDPIPVEIQADYFESDPVPVREKIVGQWHIATEVIDCAAVGEPPDLTYTCPQSADDPTGAFGIGGGQILTIAVQDRTQDPDVQAVLFLNVSTETRSTSLYLGRLERTGIASTPRALTREVNLPDDDEGATFRPVVIYTERPNAHQVVVEFVRIQQR